MTFWVVTPPAFASSHTQRAATQMLEVVIAMPSIPVRSQRATRL